MVSIAPDVAESVTINRVASVYDSRPVNAVDTFGTNPNISTTEAIIEPASAPITFEYSVQVPASRVYVLRQFYFVPTRYIYNEHNNPIPDLFTLTFFVNGSPVSENSNLIFPTWGTGGYVPAFLIAEENSVITMRARITNPAYLDIDLGFDVYIGASISMQFNALLTTGLPANVQIANQAEKLPNGDYMPLNGFQKIPFVGGR